MTILEQARKYRAIIESAMSLTEDKVASEAPHLFPSLKGDSSLVKVGTRINWNGALKRAATDLWDTESNNPDNAPTLWEDIEYREGYRVIPEVITVGKAFAQYELGWWKDDLYKSLLHSNVYTPEQYANGWEKIER